MSSTSIECDLRDPLEAAMGCEVSHAVSLPTGGSVPGMGVPVREADCDKDAGVADRDSMLEQSMTLAHISGAEHSESVDNRSQWKRKYVQKTRRKNSSNGAITVSSQPSTVISNSSPVSLVTPSKYLRQQLQKKLY